MRTTKALSIMVLGGLTGISSVSSSLACARCDVYYHLYNDGRMVTGTNLTQECPGGGHSSPWGNWGAELIQFGNRTNGKQFEGWHWESPWFQWNSCTSRQDLYPIGNSSFYNYPTSGPNAFSRQFSAPENQASTTIVSRQITVSCPRQGPLGESGGCEDVEGLAIFENVFMSLYELDGLPLPGDDFIATLAYSGANRLRLRLECDVTGCGPAMIQEWTNVQSNGISAWATLRHSTSGLILTNCQEEGPKREF